MATLYKCPNIGNCDKADKGEIISIPTGVPTQCPECKANLILVKGARSGGSNNVDSNFAILGGIVFILLLIGIGVWHFWPSTHDCKLTETLDAATNTCVASKLSCTLPEVLNPVTNSCQIPPPPPLIETLLRFHGSNTIGGKLLPALAEAFMKQEGYANVHKTPGPKEDESFIVGEQSGAKKQIEIQAHGSKTAFEDLKAGLCDIGMASRKIKAEEQQSLLPLLGDLTSNASEHVLALDGIALIVHPSNPIRTLTIAQVADIFSGTLTDWSQVGGKAGTIAVYARDDKSGTYDFFKDAVLKTHGKSLAANAQRFEDSTKLSDSVSGDPAGIGFIGLNYIGANKVIALADNGVEALKPSLLTVKTEDYMLSRRLFLYTAEKPTNPLVSKFIEFAVSAEAQPVVEKIGLVNMDLTPIRRTLEEQKNDPRSKSSRWRSLTAQATDEIPTRFRFRTGSSELDTRANRDIGRIVGILEQQKYQGKPLILIGFADGSGPHPLNCNLSQDRAEIVRRELAEEGLNINQVVGLCEEAPVAPNDTPENKEKNRRVEVWVK